VPIALGAAFLVPCLGLCNMIRRGPGNRSQMLMGWRGILQFIAIVVVMGAIWYAGRW